MPGHAPVAWPPVVAATKVQPPQRRADLVPRGDLVAALSAARAHKLTLVAAPPGSGKTTLLVLWAASPAEERPFAWLSLDDAENDPVRFWTSVIAAVRTVDPAAGRAAEAALRSPDASLTDVVVPLLINEFATRGAPLVLVLDDLHLIADARVHESLAFLLEHLPPAVHLAIATRTDPPLALGRLRARRELVEVRVGQLRFSDAEATALLNGALGLDLAPRQIAQLQHRTEGWAAGLQLAGLSLRGRAEPDAFIASFTGDDRQLVDYLAPEVLDRQPPDARDFLLETSILERLAAPLCDVVTGGEDGAARLERLEHANLPLVALDDHRGWYRYHHLFREVLRHVLEVERPGHARELHARAASWHRARGDVEDAIHHSFAAGDLAAAAELVALHWLVRFNRGELATVSSWLASLPAELVERDTRLWLARVWTALDSGRLAEVEPLLADAGRAGGGERAAWAALLRALRTFKAGDVGAARLSLAQALGAWPRPTAFWRTVAATVAGITSYWSDDVPAAEVALQEASELAEADGNRLATVYTLGYLAALRVDRARLEEAEALLDRIDPLLADDPAAAEQFISLVAHLARARLHERRAETRAAAEHAARALELARRGAGRVELAAALLARAQTLKATGERSAAADAQAEARATLASCADPGRLARYAEPSAAAPPAIAVAVPVGAPADPLSDRELAVLRLLPGPLSQREIGQELYVSLNTVKTHTRNIYAKLRAANRDEAVGRARELGLI
ncbi:MAG: helix-turn-helix transcriptional regulator [Actinobacteria bacterium]|nr:MAG: helix-turn-helix transcriptional regulator [Actinomycetota bacterium]